MILCFECPEAQKRQIDVAIAEGRYSNYSEFITVAIANQLLLHGRQGAASGFVIEPGEAARCGFASESSAPEVGERVSVNAVKATAPRRSARAKSGAVDTSIAQPSALFAIPTGLPKGLKPARAPEDVFAAGERVPLERWTLGLYNKLLPAKASVRALANLLAASPDGINLNDSAVLIAREAKILGEEFERRDATNRVDRDDRLSTAFPLPSNEEKAISRFATQFVGNVNSRGQYSGLLAALKLIGRAPGSRQTFSLTQAGWDFATLPNPCIDDGANSPRLSDDECTYLYAHIRADVPQEATCIDEICRLISEDVCTPEQLDAALKSLVSAGSNASDSFVTTQRTGAISRMSDLGLIERQREGTRVKYILTNRGREMLRKGVKK